MTICGSHTHSLSDRLRDAINHIAKREVAPAEMANHLHGLLVTGGDTTRRDYPPRMKPANAEQSAQQLLDVAKAAEALHAALRAMNAPAASTIGRLDWHLTIIGGIAITSRANRRSFEHIASIAGGAGATLMGQLPDHLSPKERLAHDAALVFWDVTGVWPGRSTRNSEINKSVAGPVASGDYIEFLREVFAARGITNGVESAAKAALRALELHRTK